MTFTNWCSLRKIIQPKKHKVILNNYIYLKGYPKDKKNTTKWSVHRKTTTHKLYILLTRWKGFFKILMFCVVFLSKRTCTAKCYGCTDKNPQTTLRHISTIIVFSCTNRSVHQLSVVNTLLCGQYKQVGRLLCGQYKQVSTLSVVSTNRGTTMQLGQQNVFLHQM